MNAFETEQEEGGWANASAKDGAMPLSEEEDTWLRLHQLLNIMLERPKDLPPNQSWRALLLRAQYCQDLWQQVQQQQPEWLQDTEQYHKWAHDVDQACRMAHQAAHQIREEQERNNPQQLAFEQMVQELFSSDPASEEERIEEHEFENEGMHEFEEEFGVDEQENPNEENDIEETQVPQETAAISSEELQRAQREQMEEAIAQMAEQMKNATKDIHSKLQHQNKDILEDMQDQVSQNVQDVTKLATNVKEHVSAGWKRSFGTWTMLFALVGVFCFALLTIFTIPKRPDACLFWGCSSSKRQKVKANNDEQSRWWMDLSKVAPDANKDKKQADDFESSWDFVYEEDETEQQEKERLSRLLKEMQREVERDSDPYDGYDMEDEDDLPPAARRRRVDPASYGRRAIEEYMQQEEQERDRDDDEDDPWEAYRKQAGGHRRPPRSRIAETRTNDNQELSWDPPQRQEHQRQHFYHKESQVPKPLHFTANDMRLAAGRGDIESLKRYLEERPGDKDSVDRQGRTLIHYAVLGGHTACIQWLVETIGCDPGRASKDGQRPVDLAIQQLGDNHDAVRVLTKLESDRYARVRDEL